VESSCEFGIKALGSIKCWETIQWSNSCWPLEQCSAPEGKLVCAIFVISYSCNESATLINL
jgi:hypothetical protein